MNCCRMKRRTWSLTMKNYFLKNSCLTSLNLMNSCLRQMILSCKKSGLMKIHTTLKVYKLNCSVNVLKVQNSFLCCYMPGLFCCSVQKILSCFFLYSTLTSFLSM